MSVSYVTVQQFCAFHRVETVVIEEFIDHGILEIEADQGAITVIPENQLPRLECALRLRNDLGINSPGIDVILRLLERIHGRGPVDELSL